LNGSNIHNGIVFDDCVYRRSLTEAGKKNQTSHFKSDVLVMKW